MTADIRNRVIYPTAASSLRNNILRKFSNQREMSKLHQLREVLKAGSIDAYIIGSGDAHQSEYVAKSEERRAFISDFTGSAGTALVLADQALLWTDGRYFLQASQELSADWTLMRSGNPGVLEMNDWINTHMKDGQVVGVDPFLISTSAAKALAAKLAAKGIKLEAVNQNCVDKVWNDRPLGLRSHVIFHPLELAGESTAVKISRVQEKLRAARTDALVVSMLDEIAWLFNVRGSDVEYNPVVTAYGVVTLDHGTHLFIDPAKVEGRGSSLDGVIVHAYEEIGDYLKHLASLGLSVQLDPAQLNWGLSSIAAAGKTVEQVSPIQLMKSIKNEVELNGIRQAHIRDGAALTAFLGWLDSSVRAGAEAVTECSLAEVLETYRGKMVHHVSPSFATIAGYGPNGAIIHYRADEKSCASLGTDSVFLLDSGAQYSDGTTDVTRTMHFGVPTQRMKECYTRVLQGHIALSRVVFPEGTVGSRLDALARVPLWSIGLDYNHGTGHGVGAFLNVHEGPQGIGFRKRENEEGFYAGMTTSNEPGYYEEGSFGIRIENVCITVPAATPNNFNGRKYCKFETVTMCPISTTLIDVSLLDASEISWLNEYHALVRSILLPIIEEKFPEAVNFLINSTNPIA